MSLRHLAVLKANDGELRALSNLDARTAPKVLPLLEVGRMTDAIRERKYIRTSSTPIMAYLDRKLDAIRVAWQSRPAMVDGYEWPADARTESGDHVIAYMVEYLRRSGMSVIPVIGYDRWGNPAYRAGVRSIAPRDDGHYCLRLDSSALDDAAEPDLFGEAITDIIEHLELIPARCSILLDFADISTDSMSIERIVEKADDVIRQLQMFGFQYYAIAGCSLPRTIDLAVGKRDSVGAVFRKEILVWQTLRLSFPELHIVSGDYGVRGPTTSEVRSKYTNGKIRYSVKNQLIVARGHPFFTDHSHIQMHDLASTVAGSRHYLGPAFSWGDQQILIRSRGGKPGSTTDWIAIDTNHHLSFVVQEVEEFERDVVERVDSN